MEQLLFQLQLFYRLHVAKYSDPVAPGAVWSSSLPTPFIRSGPETAVLPSRTGVSGAQLLDVLLPSLPSVGGLFFGWALTSTSNHQVPAKQRVSGQQLWPHNTRFQQRQSTTSESPLLISFFLVTFQVVLFALLLISVFVCVHICRE